MTFDLGTLDSGERSLPFGLLVVSSQVTSKSASKEVYPHPTGISCRCRCVNAQISNANYRRPVPIFLQAQINKAQKSVILDNLQHSVF